MLIAIVLLTLVAFGYIARRLHHLSTNVETIMASARELNEKLDELQATLDEKQATQEAAADAQAAVIADLQAQLAVGTPGLTEPEVQAAIERLTAIEADLRGDEIEEDVD